MINDFNYMMFHQHLFAELNEFELAKRDQIFNSPGLDLFYQDNNGVVGLSPYHSMALNAAIQFVLIFPTALILELMIFNNSETWAGFSGYDELFENCSTASLYILLVFGLTSLFRPLTAYFAQIKFSV